MTKFADTMVFLDALELRNDLGSLTGRKRIQKTVYLLKQFGADLKFGYAWYWHGPYSPDLTKTLLEPSKDDLDSQRDITKAELETVNRLRNFLEDDLHSVDSLELLVSLVYLIKRGESGGYDSKRKIIDFVRLKKPRFSHDQIEASWNRIERAGPWDRYLEGLRK